MTLAHWLVLGRDKIVSIRILLTTIASAGNPRQTLFMPCPTQRLLNPFCSGSSLQLAGYLLKYLIYNA